MTTSLVFVFPGLVSVSSLAVFPFAVFPFYLFSSSSHDSAREFFLGFPPLMILNRRLVELVSTNKAIQVTLQ